MNNKNFFFCYNKQLFTFLHEEKKIPFITIAINPSTGKIFTMFFKNEELQVALDAYKGLQK